MCPWFQRNHFATDLEKMRSSNSFLEYCPSQSDDYLFDDPTVKFISDRPRPAIDNLFLKAYIEIKVQRYLMLLLMTRI